MKIEGQEIDIKKDYLSPVTYVPNHANNDASHVDCEPGVIIAITRTRIGVLYCKSRTVKATDPSNLVWG